MEVFLNGPPAVNDRMLEDGLDAVREAAATAFGFVYSHPFHGGGLTRWRES